MTVLQYISYPLSPDTPAYGGAQGFTINRRKCINHGDTCNEIQFTMSNHLGTHVDAPCHFDPSGQTLSDYLPDDWVFTSCCLVSLDMQPGDVVNAALLESCHLNEGVDLLLIRTGMWRYRNDDAYWKKNVIFHADLGEYLKSNFPSLQAIALDAISLSSLLDREMGREAHRAILSRGIRIFEDVNLSALNKSPHSVHAYPMMIQGGDGAPVTMVASF